MSWYGKRLPSYVKASTEDKLVLELGKISMNIGEKLEIINIYQRGSFVYCWYFLDVGKADRLPKEVKKKKKVSKKVS